MSTWEQFQMAGVIVMLAGWGLIMLSRRRPDIHWLQPIRTAFPEPSPEQRKRFSRRANIYVGAELILMGIMIPMGYVALTVMMFHDFTALGMTLTAAGSLLCIGLGITALWTNRR